METEEYALSNPACISIPVTDADRLLSCENSDCIRLYLYLLRSGKSMNAQRASEDLHISIRAVQEAGKQLKQMGLLNGGPSAHTLDPADELPQYDAAYIVTRSQADPVFRDLQLEAAQIMGHKLSTTEVQKLFGFYDELGLPAEVIIILMASCREEWAEKYGPGRIPTMRQIEKQAFQWARLEICTMEQAESYLERRRAKKDTARQLKQELGIRDRDFSPTEKKYVNQWLDWGFGIQAILIAYDRTVTRTGGLKWKYMHSILENWNTKGLYTPSQIEEGDTLPSKRPALVKTAPQPTKRTGSEKEGLMKIYEKINKK